jgi:hypothetical protein
MAKQASALALAAMVGILSANAAVAMRTQGSAAVATDALSLLGMFCYSEEGGSMTVTSSASEPVAVLLLDESGWAAANEPQCDCGCKTGTGIAYLPVSQGDTELTALVPAAATPRFVYAALLTCQQPSQVFYSLHMTDGGPGFPEIPYDAAGVLPTYIAATACAAIVLVTLTCAYSWMDNEGWQSTPTAIKLNALSILFWLCEAVCLLIHWGVYAGDGVGSATVEGAGRVADVLARLSYLMLLLLVARGWLISTPQLSAQYRWALFVAAAAFGAVYLGMGIWYLKTPRSSTLCVAFRRQCAMQHATSCSGGSRWHRRHAAVVKPHITAASPLTSRPPPRFGLLQLCIRQRTRPGC